MDKRGKVLIVVGGVLILVLLFGIFVVAGSFNPEDDREIGYEFLDDGKVVHIWNTQDDYFFEKDAGIQLTNYYEDYWSRNIFCLGYYNNDEWIKIKCADELTNFNKNIETDNLTYVNATLWKDFSYGNYDLRLAVNYYLGLNDKNLSITIYGKNIGIDIPFDLGFAWKVTDLDVPPETTDKILINNTNYGLDGNYDLTFKDMKRYVNTSFPTNQTDSNGSMIYDYSMVEVPIPFYKIYDRESGLTGKEKFLRIDWDENLDYAVKMYGDGNQESFYTALLINAGHFNPGQEKSTTFYWIDALTDDLSIYLFLNETSGTTAIDTMGNYNGTNTDITLNQTGVIAGIGAYGFTGTSSLVQLSGGAVVNGDGMFSFWMKTTDALSNRKLYNDYSSNNGRWFVLNPEGETGKLQFTMYGTEYECGTTKTSGSVIDGEWHHIVAGLGGGYCWIYVDGELNVSVEEAQTSTRVGTGGSQIGEVNYAPVADIALWGFWTREVTAEEVTELWNDGNGLAYPFVADTTAPNTTKPILNSTNGTNQSNQDLNCYATLTDAEQNLLTANWTWYKNNITNLTGSKSVQNNTPTLITTLLLGNTLKGEEWICEVKPFDGTNWGNASNSTVVTILNSAPIHTNPLLNTSTGKNLSTEDLICYNKSTSDDDNDAVINIYNWYKNSQSFLALNLPFENNTNDYSGNNNDGTNYGATFIDGKYGNKALNFDGDDNVTVPDSSTLDFTDKKSWQLWFKRAGTGAETLFNKGNSTHTNYKLEFLSDDRLKFSYSLIPGEANYSWEVDDESDFNLGTYNQTYYNTSSNAVMLSNYNGDYKSKFFDYSEKTLSFNTISFSAYIPEFEELSVEDGMVGLWHFNEDSGTIAYDETANDNDGTINGANWTTGKFNSALDFDGDGDYVNTSTNNFPIGNNDITIEAWFKIDDLDSDNSIVIYGQNLEHKAIQLVHRTSDDVLRFHYWGGYGAVATPLNDNDWHHVVAIHTNNTNHLYLDGDLKDSAAYSNANIVNNFNDIGRVTGYSSYDFDGIIDEIAIYNKSLSASEILEHYENGIGNGAVTNLSLSVRSCEENDCSDKTSNWDITDITSSSYDISSLSDNKYFQFKADFETNNTNYSPELYNVIINYSSQITGQEANITSKTEINDTDWHLATITFEKIDGNDFRLYLDNELETQKTEYSVPQYTENDLIIGQNFNGSIDEFRIYNEVLKEPQVQAHYDLDYNKIVSQQTDGGDEWMCHVTPNDGEEDGDTLNSSSLEVYWAIEFDVTDSFSGVSLNSVTINCDYPEFDQNDDSTPNTNPYGAYGFPDGNWECEFSLLNYFSKTITFLANKDKIVSVPMSEEAEMSIEEHTWLEWLYNCWHNGECWNLLTNIDDTTTDIWQRLTGTDTSVITQEDVLSYTLDATHNISINYTINIPYKSEVAVNELLPIRLYFWFTDAERTQCYSQDKASDTNRAEAPYCLPLVAEILGPNDGIVTFQVDLRPNLADGTYNFTRSIEIDPVGVWTQYGREDIGQIEVLETGDASIDVSDEDRTNKPIVLGGSPAGSSGDSGGGDSSVTNVYNTYITEEIKGEETVEDEPVDEGGVEESGKSWITGGAIGTIQNLFSGGSLIFIIAIIGGVLVVFIISRTVIKIKKK